MDIKRQFSGVHWVWGGGDISFVYEVHPLIVVKVPKSGQEERERNFGKNSRSMRFYPNIRPAPLRWSVFTIQQTESSLSI